MNTKKNNTDKIDYSEFEPGLQQPDPWDVPKDDLKELSHVLGSNCNISEAKLKPQVPARPRQHSQGDITSSSNPVAPNKRSKSQDVYQQPPLPPRPSSTTAPPTRPTNQHQMSSSPPKSLTESEILAQKVYKDNYAKQQLFASLFDEFKKYKIAANVVKDSIELFDHIPGIEKPRQYLTSYTKLLEYGFDAHKIKEALVSCDADYENSLEFLMQ
ncbi:hypothetical protein O9G_000927 [Rozella allomycis CSF55]|uniref:UBA domain-containing protein n=1 Tax=Rozella allomycis (strain CSF55) TaxID=988480 RepID=A0A075ANA4_ROZAC|nr:hypothetical protein O9G_000927 [Rozella allomycis CSF55]|eukprot:EPZ31282.1 hypothetical protein O9G_000927 [Rozella allomycis CSF55]